MAVFQRGINRHEEPRRYQVENVSCLFGTTLDVGSNQSKQKKMSLKKEELKLSEKKVYQGHEENERGKNINMWKGIQ